MANFNTNQARHLYVAKSYGATVAAVTADSAADGIIAVGTTSEPAGHVVDGHPLKCVYFVYKNADGIVTRSDSIPVGNIDYITKKSAAEMDRKLLAHTITINSGDGVAIGSLQGQTVGVNIAVRGIIDDDPRNLIPVTAAVKVGASDNASTLYKKLAIAIAKAIPTFGLKLPMFRVFGKTSSSYVEVTRTSTESTVSGTLTGIVLVATAQKWRRGLMSNKPYELVVNFFTTADIDEAWGADAVANSDVTGYKVIPSAYELADLEYFCLGERGDEFRGANWPNNYEPTYVINPADTSTTYDLLTIQYYWRGHAENVQKSPRTIHIAAPAATLTSIYNAFVSAAGLGE